MKRIFFHSLRKILKIQIQISFFFKLLAWFESINVDLSLINPEIIEESGSQTGSEGCLSVPGKYGIVTRPNYVKVKALNEEMEEVIYEGTELLARAFCHEIDHLHGVVYVSKVEDGIHDVEKDEE